MVLDKAAGWGHRANPGPMTMQLVKRILNSKSFAACKRGATAIEYGLIAALIAVAVIGGVTAIGKNANTTFTKVSAKMA